MNKGYLHMLVVQQLKESPRSGYALVKTIHEQTGWKPSYGSIYPLLEKLESQGAVTVREEGRSKIYSLTPAGNERVKDEQTLRRTALVGIHEQLKVLASLGDEDAMAMAEIIGSQLADEDPRGPFTHDLPEFRQLRAELHRLMQEGKFKTHTDSIRTITGTAAAALRKL
jgi:formylmethanofuran dehydrogenase subunit E